MPPAPAIRTLNKTVVVFLYTYIYYIHEWYCCQLDIHIKGVESLSSQPRYFFKGFYDIANVTVIQKIIYSNFGEIPCEQVSSQPT